MLHMLATASNFNPHTVISAVIFVCLFPASISVHISEHSLLLLLQQTVWRYEKAFASLICDGSSTERDLWHILDEFPGMRVHSLVLILWHMMQPDYIKTLKQAAFEGSLCHDNIQTWISIVFSFWFGIFFMFTVNLHVNWLALCHGGDFFLERNLF